MTDICLGAEGAEAQRRITLSLHDKMPRWFLLEKYPVVIANTSSKHGMTVDPDWVSTWFHFARLTVVATPLSVPA